MDSQWRIRNRRGNCFVKTTRKLSCRASPVYLDFHASSLSVYEYSPPSRPDPLPPRRPQESSSSLIFLYVNPLFDTHMVNSNLYYSPPQIPDVSPTSITPQPPTFPVLSWHPCFVIESTLFLFLEGPDYSRGGYKCHKLFVISQARYVLG